VLFAGSKPDASKPTERMMAPAYGIAPLRSDPNSPFKK